jgi:hypothetical protein
LAGCHHRDNTVPATAALGQQRVNKKVPERPMRREAIARNDAAWPGRAHAREPDDIHF